MNQNPTIHVPTKRTDEVDWANPLKRYIQTTYQEDPEKYADEANSIHRLRQDMRGAGKDITGRDLLYRYYGQLELLDLRFPVDENHIRVSFTWYDAFTHKATSQFSLAYEKASTIFNIASVLSAIATSQNRFEPEGLKRASNFFQASAGMYTYINDNFLHAPSTDLSRDTVKLLSQLMLAQAQECFLEQSLGLKKTPAFIAKLAAQAGWTYGNIVENMSDLISRNVFDRSWLTVCQVKQKYFASIAQYQKSLACEGSSKYGECVGRLNVAESLAKEANKLSNSFVSAFSPAVTPTLPPDAAVSLQDLTKSNLALITEKKNSATKDNDIVYHEVVPQESVIPPIDKLSAVKQISIQDLYGANEIQKVIGQDIFQRLIPLSVHESASLYSEEKAKMVRGETERCEISNGELEAALEYMKLPGALVKYKTISNNESRYLNELASPTSEVKQWSQLIKTEEEQKDTINNLQMTLNSLKSRAKEILDDISLILENEQRDYDRMKAKYGDLWTQAPKTLTTAFRQDLLSHSDALEKAATSDQHLFQRYNQSLNDIMILRTGENSDDLEKIFAEALASSVNTNNDAFVGGRRVSNAESLLDVDTSNSGEDINIKLQKIEECISNLNKVRKERMDTLNDLKEKTHQDDISHLLILNKKSQNIEPQLFATELEKFSPYRNRITSSIHHQQALLQELTANFKSLMESDEAKTLQTRWDHAERRRRDVCDRLRKAKDSYFEVKEGLRNGIQFYVDLTELIEKLSKNLHQNVKSCQQDRNELVQSLQAQEQRRVKDQINQLISPSTPSNQVIGNYSSIAQLTEKTNKLSINNTIPISRDLDIAHNQSSFYSATSQPYVPSTQSPVREDSYSNASAPYTGPIAPPKPSAPPTLAGFGSLPSTQSPVRKDSYSNTSASYASPIAPPKPSAPPTLAGLGSDNYSVGSSQRSTSFSAQPSYMIKPSSPKSQGPPVPPLPTGYQQQQNIVYNNSYQSRQSDIQRLYQPASVPQSQQPPQQQSSILHQNHSFTGQYTQSPQPPQTSQFHTSQQHELSTPLPPSQQPYSGSSSFFVQTPSQSMQPSYPSTNIQYSQQPPPPQPLTSSTPLPPPPQQYHQSSCDNYVPSQTGYSQVPPTNQFLQSHYTGQSSGNQYQQLQPPPQQYSGTQTQISFSNNPQVLPSQQQTIYYRPQTQVAPGQQHSGGYMQHSQGNFQPAPSQPSQPIHQGYSYHQQTHPSAAQQQKSLLD